MLRPTHLPAHNLCPLPFPAYPYAYPSLKYHYRICLEYHTRSVFPALAVICLNNKLALHISFKLCPSRFTAVPSSIWFPHRSNLSVVYTFYSRHYSVKLVCTFSKVSTSFLWWATRVAGNTPNAAHPKQHHDFYLGLWSKKASFLIFHFHYCGM